MLYAFVGGAALAGFIAFLVSDKLNTPVQPETAPIVATQEKLPEPIISQPEPVPVVPPEPVRQAEKPAPKPAPVRTVQAPPKAKPVPVAPPRVSQPESTPPPAPSVAKTVPDPVPAPAPTAAQPPKRNQILRPDAMEIQRAQEVRKAETVTLPAGTVLHVRLNQSLSSNENEDGDTFSGVLDEPLVANGFVIAERGSRVDGRVISSEKAGRVKGLSQLSIALFQLYTSDNQKIAISTDDFAKTGESSKKSDAAKVGIGAGVGAALGAIFGGGKGAAIGAATGGGAGAGTVLLTRGKPAEISVETKIPFRLREDVRITENLN